MGDVECRRQKIKKQDRRREQETEDTRYEAGLTKSVVSAAGQKPRLGWQCVAVTKELAGSGQSRTLLIGQR